MAIEVLAHEGGTMILGPEMPRQRVRSGTRVVWLWPVAEEGETLPEDVPPLPKSWEILRTLGQEELERRMKGGPAGPTDSQRARTGQDVKPVDRGLSKQDRAMIAAAQESLLDGENAHWTRAGMPAIEAVRGAFEKIEMEGLEGVCEGTGARDWPVWLTREILDSMGQRKRGDQDEEESSD